MAETKTCSSCRQSLPLEAFSRRRDSRDGRQNRCRGCWHQWYLDNRHQHIAEVQRRNALRTKNIRLRLEQHLLAHPCVDCGESDLRVLDLDHEDPHNKLGEVGKLIGCALNWQRVAQEIAKCSVRCANCHRRRTAGMFGFWRAGAELRRQEQQHDRALCRLQSVVSHPR